MFLSTIQRRILAVTGLLGLGFVLGLAIQAPSVHRAMLGTDQAPEIRPVGSPASQQEKRANEPSDLDWAEPGSAVRRPAMASYLRYLEKRQGANPGSEVVFDQGEARIGSEQRVVTVHHGSRATQYVVGRDLD